MPQMPLVERTLTEERIRQLFELACTPFKLKAFRERWEAYGWNYQPDDLRIELKTVDGWPMLIDQLDDKVLCAITPVCLWPTYSPSSHINPAEHNRVRAAFNAAFESAAALARSVLPAPFLDWFDANEEGYRAMAWEGTHGILILQQAAREIMDGVEINFWLEACTREEFCPEVSMINWLGKRAGELHDKYGYGPPVWD